MQHTYRTDNKQLRLEHQRFAKTLEPELFLTLATNQTMGIETLKKKTGAFLARMDRKMLGRNWAKKPMTQRMDGLLYIEHELTNAHVHGLMTRPYCNRIGLQLLAMDIWEKLCPSGSVVIKDIEDIARCSQYVTKEAYKAGFFDRQFFMAGA